MMIDTVVSALDNILLDLNLKSEDSEYSKNHQRREEVKALQEIIQQAKKQVEILKKRHSSIYTAGEFSSYAQQFGLEPISGKESEFESLSEDLFNLNNELYGVDSWSAEYQEIMSRKCSVLFQLYAVSRCNNGITLL